MTVNILGTPYEIIVKKYDEEEAFAKRHIAGFCDPWAREIVLCDMHTYDGWDNESEKTVVSCQKENLKHEIVHAFFYESGLWDNSVEYAVFVENGAQGRTAVHFLQDAATGHTDQYKKLMEDSMKNA